MLEDGARRPPSYFKSAIWPPKIIRNFAYQSRAVGLRATSSNTHRSTSSSTHPRASEIGYLREDGARRPSSYYDIPCLSRLVLRITASQTIVGRCPPCPVLQQEARVFTPLSNGEGLGVGLSLLRGGGSRVAARGRGFWPPCHNH